MNGITTNLISIIFGGVIGVLVSWILIKEYYTIYKGPDSNKIKEDVYVCEGKYIKFSPVVKIGPLGAKHI